MPRNKVPKVLKVLKGTVNATRDKYDEMPSEPDYQKPEMPAWVHERGADEWHLIVDFLIASKLMHRFDLATVNMYADAYGRVIELSEEIKKVGKTYMGEGDTVKTHPFVSQKEKAALEVKNFGMLLGTSAVSRAKIIPAKAEVKQEGEIASLMRRRIV